MIWLSGFLRKQGQLLLENNRHAMLHAVILALLPYTTWLSVAVIALIVLRKGSQEAVLLLIAAMTAHAAFSLTSMTAATAIVNALLTFVPCYMAACILRLTSSWRAVAGICLLQVIVAVLLLQVLMPDYIMAQYLYIQAVVNSMQTETALMGLINDKNGLNQLFLANYLLGIQAAGIMFSAVISLMLARSVQSQLYYPGGFGQEMLRFRGDRIGLVFLLILLAGVKLGNVLAMNVLPLFLLYFLLAGLSLSFNVLARKRSLSSLLLLITPLLLLPFIMLPVYVIFGSLDSLFNFRLYLPAGAGKRT